MAKKPIGVAKPPPNLGKMTGEEIRAHRAEIVPGLYAAMKEQGIIKKTRSR